MSQAVVVLHSSFGSNTVAISAVFCLGNMRSLEAFWGRVGFFFTRAALNVTADIVAHLAPQHGFDSYTAYEVEPDDMQHLEDQQ